MCIRDSSSSSERGFHYKYAKDISAGDELFSIGFEGRVLEVVENEAKKVNLGVYSPYTSVGNFFVVAIDKETRKAREKAELILVHCLAHVPANYHSAFHYLMDMSEWLPIDRSPDD